MLIGLFSLTMLPPVFVAFIYQDGGGNDFLAAFFVTLFIGFVFWLPNRRHKGELKARRFFNCGVVLGNTRQRRCNSISNELQRRHESCDCLF